MLATREHVRADRELRELEELWEAPAALEPPPARASLLDRIPHVPWWVVAGGWVLFFLVAFTFEPAPEPGMATPVWAGVAAATMLLLLFGGATIGRAFSPGGFACAAVAGALGIALAVECHASAHHLGSWWLVELGATCALMGAALTGLVGRLRR